MTEVNIENNQEIERNWAMLAHFLGLAPMPILNVLGPLLVWLLKKDSSTYIQQHAKEAVNFQVTVLIGLFISFWFCAILIGFLMIGVILITNIVLVFACAIKAKHGEIVRYPFALRFF